MERLVPGYGYVNETGTAQRLIPGALYVNETVSAGSSVSLTVADAGHTNVSDGMVLTTQWLLAIAEALHGHAADNLTLDTGSAIALTVQESTHGHIADSLDLTLDTWLGIVEAAHANVADAPMLTVQVTLQIADALHAMYADTVILGMANFTQDQLDYLLTYMESNMNIWDQPIDGSITARQMFVMMSKVLRNKMITDPATGMLTIYDDDGVTVLLSGHIYKDAAGSVPYNGTGAERRERLT